jgi:hypothetical protein
MTRSLISIINKTHYNCDSVIIQPQSLQCERAFLKLRFLSVAVRNDHSGLRTRTQVDCPLKSTGSDGNKAAILSV